MYHKPPLGARYATTVAGLNPGDGNEPTQRLGGEAKV